MKVKSKNNLFFIHLALPLILFFILFSVQVYYSGLNSRRSAGGAGLFFSESAVHYHYARLIAEGKEIPEIDKRLQYPEGVDTREELTIFMEYLPGMLGRLLETRTDNYDFQDLVILCTCLTSSMTIFPLYFTVLRLFPSLFAALTAAALWTFSLPSFVRTVGSYLRENFTLPFFYGAILFTLLSFRKGRRTIELFFTVILLLITLGSWHMSQFLWFLYCLALLIICFREHVEEQVAKKCSLIIFGVALGSLFFPHLRSRWFLLSFNMIPGWLVVIVYLLRKKIANRKTLLGTAAAGAVILGAASFLTFSRYEAYGHAFKLIADKILHFNLKPEDPAALSFDSRVFWMGPWTSPHPLQALYYMGVLMAFGWTGFLKTILRKEKRKKINAIIMGCMLVIFTFLYIIFDRMMIPLSFFAAFWTAGLIGNSRSGRKRKWKWICVGLIIFELYFFSTYTQTSAFKEIMSMTEANAGPPVFQTMNDEVKLLSWISRNTTDEDVFLAPFSMSPFIFEYAGRPVTLHPMFESAVIRRKVEISLRALFSKDEDALYQFCRENEVDYIILPADFMLDRSKFSARYLVDRLNLDEKFTVFQLHFEPSKPVHFRLVFQNSFYRIYRLFPNSYDSVFFEGRSPLLFDLSLFVDIENNYSDSAVLDVRDRIMKAREAYSLGVTTLEQNDTKQASEWFHKVLQIDPFFNEALFQLTEIMILEGDYDAAAGLYEKHIKIKPWNPLLHAKYGLLLSSLEQYEEAAEQYRITLNLEPHAPGIHTAYGVALLKTGQYKKAESQWLIALDLNPQDRDAHNNLAVYYAKLAEPDVERARTHLKKALQLGLKPSTEFLEYLNKLEKNQ